MASTGDVFFSSATQVCRANRLCWDLSPKQIQQMSKEIISKTKQVYDAVGTLDLDNVTFSNTLKALADAEAEYLVLRNMFRFIRLISPLKRLRIASTCACEELEQFLVDMSMRKDIYQRIKALSKKVDIDNLTSEDRRYMEGKLGKANGLKLPKDKQEEIKNISKQILERFVCEKQSVAMLKKIVKLGFQMSALLGFKTYADYVLQKNMANSSEKVSIFLDELAHNLKPLGDEERAVLLKLKKEQCQKARLPFNGKLYEKDLYKYAQVIQKDYGVDHKRLKEYFPLEVVTQGLLHIFQDLLGLSFSLVDGDNVWHPDVMLYCATDVSSRQIVGQFYLDLFNRKGKFKEEFCFGLQPGCLLSDGSRQTAVVALVTSFSKPKTTPCLLSHEEVLTLFHEFGHVMHYICAQVDYAVFNSFGSEEDFIEAPSQIFENWAWEKEPLQRVSKHYKTGAPIPDDMLDKLISSRLANIGMTSLEDIIMAKLDQALYTQTGLDPRKEYARLRKEILGVPPSHIVNITSMFEDSFKQYHANCYRYLWAEVLSMDMFYSRFKCEGIMNPKVGLDYRNCILKPGGSKDAIEMLTNFLGREPNPEAFLLSKGLTTLKTRKRKLKESQVKKRKRN